jgi:hypothetical protein
MFRVSKRCHQDFSLLHTYHIFYITYFWVKSGEKWFTYSVFSPSHTMWWNIFMQRCDGCKCASIFVNLGMMIEKLQWPKFDDQKVSITL